MQSQLYWHIHKLAFLLEKKADEVLREQLDIGYAQYKVLQAINQNELSRQNTVADMLDQTEASISRQIKILQKKGMINAHFVMGNKRAKELSLTRVGEDIIRQASAALDLAQSETFGTLNAQEQRLMSDFLDRMLMRTK